MIADKIFSTGSTRLTGRRLILARTGWILILLYVIWKLVLGAPLYYAELQQVCTETKEICSLRVSPSEQDAHEIEAAGMTLQNYANVSMVLHLIDTVVWVGVGLIIFALRSDDWMALLASATMIMLPSGSASDPIARVYPQIAWFAQLGFSLQNILLFLLIGLFPNGKSSPRWMRWYWLLMISLGAIDRILQIFQLGGEYVWGIGWLSFLTFGPYSQIYRYLKASNRRDRQQIKWVVFGFATFAGLGLFGFFLTQINVIPDFSASLYFAPFSMLIPIGFGVAVLRYRLWDIDVIIRRTLVYGGLTLTLALVFFGGVAVLQQAFGKLAGVQNSPIAIVISTLLIAALFSPLRRRIQADIDRRFYRRKYNAEQALASFSATARDETDIRQLKDELLAVVQETMQPESASLWIRE